jgi:ribosomal protein S18 acetylase RimI-like enzyme
LRGVEKRDLPAIAELEEIAFKANGLPRSALDVIYDTSGGLWLLAEDDEGIWGYSVNVRGEDERMGWIVGMAVHPERQRRAWGKYLLAATIDLLRRYDMEVIRLLVHPSNKIARRLYEEIGFLDTGERVDHFGADESRMLMSLLVPRVPGPAWQKPAAAPQVPSGSDTDGFAFTRGTSGE